MSIIFTIFDYLKIGLVCSAPKDEKVIIGIACLCSMNKGFTFDS